MLLSLGQTKATVVTHVPPLTLSSTFVVPMTFMAFPSGMIELINTEGKAMKVIGTTKILLRVRGGTWVTTVALVCPRLSHQMLLSWQTQNKLQMLHEGWPFSITFI